MRLTAKQCTRIKAPVCGSRDNSDENTARRLAPTTQFKARGSDVSAQVRRTLPPRLILPSAPDGSCLRTPPRRSGANRRGEGARAVSCSPPPPACCLAFRGRDVERFMRANEVRVVSS
ncbi:hypothetical protein EYF80_039053 [Liparis tanakae]|uniref:Uncharacterized protein n=1 Tax=Liparis tanakae TaxID=230148 RepID=A0A4Z2GDI8_9TELE|nr:hypothetical protein EYF80_039053 [Liparis tanakae]